MQMISEVGAEQNSTTVIMMPSEFVTLAKAFGEQMTGQKQRMDPVRNGG
jgi:hypothetical protein